MFNCLGACVAACHTPSVSRPHPAMKHFLPAVKFWPSGGKHTGWTDSVTDTTAFRHSNIKTLLK